jgi:hypothetical protein
MLDCAISSSVTEVSMTVRPADMHENPKRIFPCDECDNHYTQRQGVTRHQREAHGKKNLCPNCNDFTWIRRYQLTKHLKEKHPGIDLNETLNEVTRWRRQTTKNRKHLRQQQAPPTTECDRKSHNEPLPRSPMHTLPTVAKDSRFSIHTILPVVYDPYPEHHAERPVTSCKREDARGLDLFGATIDAPSASSSAEERFQVVNDVGTSVQHGKIWLAYPFYSCHMTSDPFQVAASSHGTIMARFPLGKIPSISRDGFDVDTGSRKHRAGRNRRLGY